MRTYENAVLQGDSLKDRGVILYLYPRANLHMSIDVDALTDAALLTDLRILSHLSLAPDARARSHLRRD